MRYDDVVADEEVLGVDELEPVAKWAKDVEAGDRIISGGQWRRVAFVSTHRTVNRVCRFHFDETLYDDHAVHDMIVVGFVRRAA